MKNSTRSAALRQHVCAKITKPTRAAPATTDPVQWSTGEPNISAALDVALVKLIAAGTNRPDAVAVLQELSGATEDAQHKLADDLGEIDKHYLIDVKSAIALSMAPGEMLDEILGDAKRFALMADSINVAAHDADDAKWLSLAASLLCGMAASYNRIAIRAIEESRRHG